MMSVRCLLFLLPKSSRWIDFWIPTFSIPFVSFVPFVFPSFLRLLVYCSTIEARLLLGALVVALFPYTLFHTINFFRDSSLKLISSFHNLGNTNERFYNRLCGDRKVTVRGGHFGEVDPSFFFCLL